MPNAADIVNQLFPNLWVFLAHTLATISLLIILSKLVYQPFKKAMRARRQGIKNILIEANKKQDLAEKKATENINLLEENRSKVNKILTDAQSEATEDKKKIIDEASNQANEMIGNAKEQIISENKKNTENAKEIIAKNSILIAQKIIEKKLTTADHKNIIDSFIENLDLNGEYND